MSTDQTLPGPASSRLAGPGDIAEPAAGLDGTDGAGPGEPDRLPSGPAQATLPAMGSATEPATEPVTEPGTEAVIGPPQQRAPQSAVIDQPSQLSPVSSRQAEASGQLVAMSFPGARRVAGWLFWVIFPLLCIATIHASVSNAVHHLGNKPVGVRGTFVVQPRSCSQGFCSFGGLFTSDDHTIRNLPLLGDPRWHTAEVHRVTYDPRSVEVTALPGHWDPTPSVMAAFGALTYLVVIGYFLRERQRRSRREAAGD